MSTTDEKILEIENRILNLTNQYENQLKALELEKAKLINPKIWEFVEKNFAESNIYFSKELFGKHNSWVLQYNFGVKYLSIPVQIQPIDTNKVLVTGLKQELSEKISSELFDELNKQTQNVFPLEFEVVNAYCHLGENYSYGKVITPNPLNINYVELSYGDKIINDIGFYYKSI